MTSPERLRFETFSLGSDEVGGVVHLRSRLPEVIAMGIEAWLEFKRGVFPLGGPHAVVTTDTTAPSSVRITTPECEFEYQVVDLKADEAGWYFLLKRTYVSSGYAAWVNTR